MSDMTAGPNPAATLDTNKVYPAPPEPAAFDPATFDSIANKGDPRSKRKEARIKATTVLIGVVYIASPIFSLLIYIALQQLLVIATGHHINFPDIVGLLFQLSPLLLLPGIIPILLGVGIIARKDIARKIAVFMLEIGILGAFITASFRIGDVHSLGAAYFPDFLPYVYAVAILGFCATLAIAIAMLGFLSRNSVKQYFS